VVLGVHVHSAQPNGWQELRSRHVNLVLRPHPLATALTAKPRPQQTRLESRLESVSAVLRAGHPVSCTQRGGRDRACWSPHYIVRQGTTPEYYSNVPRLT